MPITTRVMTVSSSEMPLWRKPSARLGGVECAWIFTFWLMVEVEGEGEGKVV